LKYRRRRRAAKTGCARAGARTEPCYKDVENSGVQGGDIFNIRGFLVLKKIKMKKLKYSKFAL
jgi:hypothetical protein